MWGDNEFGYGNDTYGESDDGGGESDDGNMIMGNMSPMVGMNPMMEMNQVTGMKQMMNHTMTGISGVINGGVMGTKTEDVKQVFDKMLYSPHIRFLVGLVSESEENEHFDELTGFKCPDCNFVGKNM